MVSSATCPCFAIDMRKPLIAPYHPAREQNSKHLSSNLQQQLLKMKTIKAGIIGTGFIGPAHVEAARRLGFVEMTGLCEANEELARAKAAKLYIPKAYSSVAEFLANKEIEVVHNCTPNHLHFNISK